MTMKLFVLLILAVFASKKKEDNVEKDPENKERIGKNDNNPTFIKTKEDEYVRVNKKSKYVGVSYHSTYSKWHVQRWSKVENKKFFNGCYDNEETAAHASDTLARKLMKSGEQKLKLNFPDDRTEVYREKSSKHIGVTYDKKKLKWHVQRYSKYIKKMVLNGYYDNEETAAHASDTLARKLMEKGEQVHRLNFPGDYTEVYREEKQTSSKYIAVSYNKYSSKWCAQRWSKNENKTVSNGCYDDEETAAHASDTLARKLMDSGEQGHKLNFPDDHNIENQDKRKRPKDLNLEHPQIN